MVGEISGPARAVLTAERTLLNLLCHLSGVATLTAAYVAACAPATVLDTRKTTPGLRALEKDAVRAGRRRQPPHGPLRPGAGEGQPPRAGGRRAGRRRGARPPRDARASWSRWRPTTWTACATPWRPAPTGSCSTTWTRRPARGRRAHGGPGPPGGVGRHDPRRAPRRRPRPGWTPSRWAPSPTPPRPSTWASTSTSPRRRPSLSPHWASPAGRGAGCGPRAGRRGGSARSRGTVQCSITRMHIGSEPGTGISLAHRSGMLVSPAVRAATAGNSAVRSGVTVKMIEIRSSVTQAVAADHLARAARWSISRIASAVFSETEMAPRIALTTGALSAPAPPSRPAGSTPPA